jgi:hypothetical protein
VKEPIKEPVKEPIIEPVKEPVKEVEVEEKEEALSVTYYNAPASVSGIKKIALPLLKGERSNDKISAFFSAFVTLNYEPAIKSLLNEKKRLNLNDWGYLTFLYKVSEGIYNDNKDSRYLFTWVTLLKSGYDVRVGYNDKRMFLLIKTDQNLYATPYFKFSDDESKFYIAGLSAEDKSKVGQMYSYKENLKDATKKFDISLDKYPILGSETGTKRLNFLDNGKGVSFDFVYSKGLINFYFDYPQTNNGIYFSTPFSKEAEKSLRDVFTPVLAGKTDEQKVDFLLSFTQTATGYQIDQEQFNREKPMFAEETLYYDFTDCEDRSVLICPSYPNVHKFESCWIGLSRTYCHGS